MKYISMFSGIEAASVAFAPLGWEPLCFAEVEPFPSAVLKHHYPTVPNVGDMTAHNWAQYRGACDLVVGGPPCQAFSVAGLRGSLTDDRGNLSLAYVRAIRAIDPLWSLTENVPGWLSTTDNAFGCVLAGLVGADAALVSPLERGRWPDAGVVSGPERTAAWRCVDAQYLGLAQRRKRVFVLSIRGAGNWACAAALLPVGESLSGHPAPRREAGERATGTLSSRASAGGGLGTDFDVDGGLTFSLQGAGRTSQGSQGSGWNQDVSFTLNLTDVHAIAHSLRADGFDASEDGTGRGTPMVAVAFRTNQTGAQGPIHSVELTDTLAQDHPPAVAFDARQSDVIQYGDMSGPLDTDGHTIGIQTAMAVRRLTPRECCRLMGFPDTYLDILYRGKPAADGPKYRALGNSMAVPCMAWLGRRIALVEKLIKERAA